MNILDVFKPRQKRHGGQIALSLADAFDECCSNGYTSLANCPEIIAGVRTISEMISSMTIYLEKNTEHGDQRLINQLSRKIDIEPCKTMTRRTWMDWIVMTMLLYGNGNAVVYPHTDDGLLGDLEPIPASRVSFMENGRDYKILIDGIPHDGANFLLFVHNPDERYPWKGAGLRVPLREVAERLKQAGETETAFMKSKWKPTLIVKVDALTEEFSSPEGREKLADAYLHPSHPGEPWIIPADQFQIEQVRPLSLADLAINDQVKLDKQTVAAIIGVPPFILGVGEYSEKEWNNFVNRKIKPIAEAIEQELTRKLIINPQWYLKFNIMSLMDYDIKTIVEVFNSMADRGYVDGNEVRNKVGLSPRDGLDELKILENYIPVDMSGNQKKLVQKEDK